MKNNMNQFQYLDIDGVAFMLHKTPRTIRQMCYDKKLPHFIVGKKRLFKHEEIIQWMEKECRAN